MSFLNNSTCVTIIPPMNGYQTMKQSKNFGKLYYSKNFDIKIMLKQMHFLIATFKLEF